MDKIFSRIFLIFLSVFLTFAFLEVGSTIWLHHFASPKEFLRYASLDQLQERWGEKDEILIPHRYLGYYTAPGYAKDGNKHNSLGYRGDEFPVEKPEGEFRIACLGGSTTYSADVRDHRKAYPALLEKYLKKNGYENVRVINAGVGGYRSWETLINFQFRVLDLDPDLVIVYHGINDIHTRLVWPPEKYRGDNSGSKIADQTPLIMPQIYEYSNFLRIVMINHDMIDPHSALERTLDKSADSNYVRLFSRQNRKETYPEGIFEEVPAAEMFRTNPPVYFERNIRNLIATAKAWDVDVMLSSFAYCPDFHPTLARTSSPEYKAAHEENRRLMKKIAEDTGVHFYDFAAVFPKDKSYFADGIHVNEVGSEIKAKLFADFIVMNEIIPRQAGGPDRQVAATKQGTYDESK